MAVIPAPVSATVWSGAELVIVAFPEVPLNVTPVPAVKVTSVPLLLLSVSGEDEPVKVRSVVPVAVEAIVTIASADVPVVVSVMPLPSTNFSEPPVFDRVSV